MPMFLSFLDTRKVLAAAPTVGKFLSKLPHPRLHYAFLLNLRSAQRIVTATFAPSTVALETLLHAVESSSGTLAWA